MHKEQWKVTVLKFQTYEMVIYKQLFYSGQLEIRGIYLNLKNGEYLYLVCR